MAAEKDFENRIKRYLSSKGIWYVKYFANGFTKKGIPDLLCCVNGRFVAVEVKAENGRATPLQLKCIERIKESGGVALVLYPSDFEEFKELIESML